MDTRKIEKFLKDFGLHILTVLAGLVLLCNPDGATALVTKLVGWFMVILGAWILIEPALKKIHIATGTWIHGGLLILVGVLLLAKPMIIADSLGRLFGILLVIEGISNLKSGLRVLTLVGGIILILMPRTLFHTLLGVVGLVLIVIGVVNILGKVRDRKRLEAGKDPNLIDAEP